MAIDIIAIPLIAFVAFWIIAPFIFPVKKDLEDRGFAKDFVGLALLIVPVILLIFVFPLFPVLDILVVPNTNFDFMLGFVIDCVGVAFMIWARVVLGGNWSVHSTVKEGNSLVTIGPYGIVRHPIYTGAIVSILGAAIYVGLLAYFLGLVVFVLAVLWKISEEEELFDKHFPAEYAEYRRKVKALVPFIY